MGTSVILNRQSEMTLKSFLLFFILFLTSAVSAQTLTDFSGTWIQDKAKTEGLYKDFDVTTVINQTPQTISIKTIFYDKSGKEMATRESSFNLDGKEVNIKEEGGVKKESAKWSADKKTLTTSSTRTYGNDLVGFTAIYSLSGDGLVLTIKTADINPMAASAVQVFNKKKS
jgi:hypothetical protein